VTMWQEILLLCNIRIGLKKIITRKIKIHNKKYAKYL